MEQKLNAAKLLGLTPSQVLLKTPTRFYSNAKAPLHTLSNFYGCSCVVEGHEFVSAEHAYQALQKMSNLSDWVVGYLQMEYTRLDIRNDQRLINLDSRHIQGETFYQDS